MLAEDVVHQPEGTPVDPAELEPLPPGSVHALVNEILTVVGDYVDLHDGVTDADGARALEWATRAWVTGCIDDV